LIGQLPDGSVVYSKEYRFLRLLVCDLHGWLDTDRFINPEVLMLEVKANAVA
jgi:hypothetical protein